MELTVESLVFLLFSLITLGGALLVVGTVLGCSGLLWAERIVRGAGDG